MTMNVTLKCVPYVFGKACTGTKSKELKSLFCLLINHAFCLFSAFPERICIAGAGIQLTILIRHSVFLPDGLLFYQTKEPRK